MLKVNLKEKKYIDYWFDFFGFYFKKLTCIYALRNNYLQVSIKFDNTLWRIRREIKLWEKYHSVFLEKF